MFVSINECKSLRKYVQVLFDEIAQGDGVSRAELGRP